MVKKQASEVAVRREAALAAMAWERLETAAKKTMNGGTAPSLQLVADTAGITALIRDEHGTSVTIQRGRISVNVTSDDVATS